MQVVGAAQPGVLVGFKRSLWCVALTARLPTSEREADGIDDQDTGAALAHAPANHHAVAVVEHQRAVERAYVGAALAFSRALALPVRDRGHER